MIAVIVVAVLVAVGGGTAAAIILLGGGNDAGSGGGSTPEDTARAYVDAIRHRDCDAVKVLSTGELESAIDCESDLVPPEDLNVEFGDPEVTDRTDTEAVAAVPVSFNGAEVTINLGLVYQDGAWLVDHFGMGGISGTSLPMMPSFSIPSS